MRDDSPAPALLDDVLELAEILEPTWPAHREVNRREAAFLNDGEEDEPEGGGQPSPDDTHSPEGNQGGGEEYSPDFLDEYDLGEVPEAARPAAEATIKRLNAAYTRQRQEDSQAVRDAQQNTAIVEALLDPNPAVRAAVAGELGLTEAEQERVEDELEDEFDVRDPRVDKLIAERDQERQVNASTQRVQAENAFLTETIEDLESKLQREYNDASLEFSDDEISSLVAIAENNRDANGIPDIDAAYRILEAAGSSSHARASKPRPRAPRRLGGGRTGERAVDLTDEEARQDAMTRAGAAARASSE